MYTRSNESEINMIKDETLYIAGPLVFYERGSKMWDAFGLEAEFEGFKVSIPNHNNLEFEIGNKRSLSAAIIKNCRDSMNISTGIIANLENFRGFMPDGGTIFEIGMAYGLGATCVAYTRDKRGNGFKYAAARYLNDTQIDLDNRTLPHRLLPFGPCIMGSCKVVEGGFSQALQVYIQDIEEASKLKANRSIKITKTKPEATLKASDKPRVYLASFERYDNDAIEKFDVMKKICAQYGFEAMSPLDKAEGVDLIESDDLMETTYNQFDHYQQHVRNCDIILANLSDYQGYEPNDDVAFECGMAYQLKKKCFAYMSDLRPMAQRIPNDGAVEFPRDVNGLNVEDFDGPVNLMFGATYRIYDGSFEEVVKKMAEECKNPTQRDDLVEAV